MEAPRYCKDCHSFNSWQRYPEKDIKWQPSGQVAWFMFRCRTCGNTTPVMNIENMGKIRHEVPNK